MKDIVSVKFEDGFGLLQARVYRCNYNDDLELIRFSRYCLSHQEAASFRNGWEAVKAPYLEKVTTSLSRFPAYKTYRVVVTLHARIGSYSTQKVL